MNTKQLTEQEQKDFQDMITACGRSPADFSIEIIESSGNISITNTRLYKQKEYNRDDSAGWVLVFATDLKMGVL